MTSRLDGSPQQTASRSAGDLVLPSRPCCLRCSKLQARIPGLLCVMRGDQRACERCHSSKKKCNPVPVTEIARLNRLLAASDACSDPEPQPALVAALDALQSRFTSRVESVMRGAQIPPTVSGMGLAILDLLADIRRSLVAMRPNLKASDIYGNYEDYDDTYDDVDGDDDDEDYDDDDDDGDDDDDEDYVDDDGDDDVDNGSYAGEGGSGDGPASDGFIVKMEMDTGNQA